jgi:hypothetical protein
MTEEEQIFYEQEKLWQLYPRWFSKMEKDTDLPIYFEFIKRMNVFHSKLVKIQREKLLFPSIIQKP